MVEPRQEFLGAITLLDEDGTGTVDSNDANLTNTGYLILNERSGAPATGAGKGSFWVSNDSPTLPKFTDSAGTTITLGTGGGGGPTPPLDEVLDVGNETGTNWIEINDGFGLRGQAFGSSFTIKTIDGLSGTSGSIEIKTGTQGNPTASSGNIDILTRSTAGYSGNLTIKTEASGKKSGDIEISTDISGSGSEGSGGITIVTGPAGGSDAGDLSISTGGYGTGRGGDISITTGVAGGDRAGHLSITTGDGASGGQGGNVTVTTGDAASTNQAGDFILTTGGASAARAGNVSLTTGNASSGGGAAGTILLQTGDGNLGAGAAAGSITLVAGQGGISSSAGNINVYSGIGTSSGGGAINLNAGHGNTTGGSINIYCGNGTTTNGGSINISAGAGNTWGGSTNISAGTGTTDAGGNIALRAGGGATINGAFTFSIENDQVLEITDIAEPESLSSALTTNTDIWMKATIEDGNKFYIGTVSRASDAPTGDVVIFTGESTGSGGIYLQPGDSGSVYIYSGGASTGGAPAGSIWMNPGDSSATGAAGDIYLTAGRCATQDGGDVKLTGGRGDSTNGGNVILYGGRPHSTGNSGEILFGTTDDGGSAYTIARIVDRGISLPEPQRGRAFRFEYFYSLDASIALDDADGVSGKAATNLYIWGSSSAAETTLIGSHGGNIVLTAGDGGDSSSNSGGDGGNVVLRGGTRGLGTTNGYRGYVQIDNILRMDTIGSQPLWTPDSGQFLMFNLAGLPQARVAGDANNYKVALVLQATLNHNFGLILAYNYLEYGLTVTGAKVGDHAIVSVPGLEAGLIATAYVSATNTAMIRVNNTTSGSIDPVVHDYFVSVIKATGTT